MVNIKYFILFVLLIDQAFAFGQINQVPDKINEDHRTRISLNGTWNFSDDNLNKSFDKKIIVPGEWEMQGYKVDAGFGAVYQRSFSTPDLWQGNQIFLRCDGIYSFCEIVINGQKIGSHLGGMTAFEFDVSKFVRRGQENEILIKVISETLADTLLSGNQYASHSLGGITRKLYLYAKPKVYMGDLVVKTSFDNEFKNAKLEVDCQIINSSIESEKVSIDYMLVDQNGESINLDKSTIDENVVEESSKWIKTIFEIISPEKWNPESPNLYSLLINVSSRNGDETIEKKIGFRSVEVVANHVFLNGKPIRLKGVNHHEVHPFLGRSLNLELWKKDVELYKGANINYLRTSHYPSTEEFVAFCDSIGIIVEMEAPFCWVGHGANAKWKEPGANPHNPEFYNLLKKSITEVVGLFKNNPSVLIWSLANESFWGPNWEKAYGYVKRIDPTRLITFHDQAFGDFNNEGSSIMPIANFHYPGFFTNVKLQFQRPLIFGEYCHLNTYNRSEIAADPGVRDSWGRVLKSMWENMYSTYGSLGGAIWSGIDDVFHMPDGRLVGYGEWGPIDAWRRVKPEYYHVKKVYSPVKIMNTNVPYSAGMNFVRLLVENRFDFTDLSECDFLWEINGAKGIAELKLEPRSVGYVDILFECPVNRGDHLKVKVERNSKLIDEYLISIGEKKRTNIQIDVYDKDEIDVEESIDKIILKTENSSYEFNKILGCIAKIVRNEVEILFDGSDFMILPLSTQEILPENELNIEPLNNTCHLRNVEIVEVDRSTDTMKVSVGISYEEGMLEVDYYVLNTGELALVYRFISNIEINPRQWGMTFFLDKKFSNLYWERKGLWSVYPSYHIGRNVGQAKAFNPKVEPGYSFNKAPAHDWKFDTTPMGTNDFRSTKENIYFAGLTNEMGVGVNVRSDATHAFRSFVDSGKVGFLVAQFSTGGGDVLVSPLFEDEHQPVKKGDVLKGTVILGTINKSLIINQN